MNKTQDIDWEAVRWHKYTDSEIARLVGRSRTQVARVRRHHNFPSAPKKERKPVVEKPSRLEQHASRTSFRPDPSVVVREEKHGSKTCYVIYVDGEVLTCARGIPILFSSITSVRERKALVLENAKNGEKATTSICWTLTKGSNASAYAKRLQL